MVEAEIPLAEWSSVVSLEKKSSKVGLRKVGEGTPTSLSLSLDLILWAWALGCPGVILGTSLW